MIFYSMTYYTTITLSFLIFSHHCVIELLLKFSKLSYSQLNKLFYKHQTRQKVQYKFLIWSEQFVYFQNYHNYLLFQ